MPVPRRYYTQPGLFSGLEGGRNKRGLSTASAKCADSGRDNDSFGLDGFFDGGCEGDGEEVLGVLPGLGGLEERRLRRASTEAGVNL